MSKNNKYLGVLFKYAVAFDSNNVYMGRIDSDGNVVSDGGETIGYVKYDGEVVKAGNIIIRQRGTNVHPGNNVGIGSDDTLFALIDGKVKFERKGRDKKQVSVYPAE